MTGGYQQQVYSQPAIGVPGDRASQNPIATYDAGPGGLVAGASGVAVGYFAWVAPPTDPNGTSQVANNFGAGNVAGIVMNNTQALNTVFLSDATLVIPEGLPVALMVQGDFDVINNGTTEAVVGQKVYANFQNGQASFAATGTPTAGATSTGSTVTQETVSITGSIVGDLLTVTVAGSTIYPGAVITTGTGVAPNTAIASQVLPLLSGETAGGVGRYNLTISQQKTIASESMTLTYGLLTIGGTVTGTFQVGQTLTGTTIAGFSITANVSGSGGSGGTMVTNYTGTTISSQSIGTSANVETKWVAACTGLPGALVKITSWVGSQG
jgi:hypothetical protein